MQTPSLQALEFQDVQAKEIGETLVKPMRTEVVSLTSGIQELAAQLQTLAAAEPQPQFQLRVRAIHAVDQGTSTLISFYKWSIA